MRVTLVKGTAILIAAISCLAASFTLSKEPAEPRKLARPPKWSPDDLNTFFPDARTKLVGTRPDFQNGKTIARNSAGANKTESQAKVGDGWSKLIDAETIETEIKRIGSELAKLQMTPSAFKGGGYKECRRQFSVLAALFAIDGEYDGEVRWKDAAPRLRDLFARAGRNCKAGSDQTFQEASLRRQNLVDLIAGSRPKPNDTVRKADWPKVADRPPLMQRMNIAHEDRLKKWLASKTEFTTHRDDIGHESQVAAGIAKIISHEGYEYADDDQYATFARELKEAATDVSAAAEHDSYDQARQGSARMTKACADCHEGFRS